MLTGRLPHQPLASLQRIGGFFCQLLRRSCGSREEFRVRYDLRCKPELHRAFGIEGLSQLNQLGGAEIADAGGNRVARTEFRYQSQVDKRHLELCALAGVDKVAVRQHCGSATDGGTLHSGNNWLIKSD